MMREYSVTTTTNEPTEDQLLQLRDLAQRTILAADRAMRSALDDDNTDAATWAQVAIAQMSAFDAHLWLIS